MRNDVRFISRGNDYEGGMRDDYMVTIGSNEPARVTVTDAGIYRGVGRAATHAEIEAIREFKYAQHVDYLEWAEKHKTLFFSGKD